MNFLFITCADDCQKRMVWVFSTMHFPAVHSNLHNFLSQLCRISIAITARLFLSFVKFFFLTLIFLPQIERIERIFQRFLMKKCHSDEGRIFANNVLYGCFSHTNYTNFHEFLNANLSF